MYVHVPNMETDCCLGSKGNGVSLEEGGKGGPGPPERGKDKQSNKVRDNMGKEEEEQSSRTWWRRIGANIVSVNMIAEFLILIIVSYFQENKSYGIKTICIDPLSTHCWTSCHEQYSTISYESTTSENKTHFSSRDPFQSGKDPCYYIVKYSKVLFTNFNQLQ
jgi:hypothetical protein